MIDTATTAPIDGTTVDEIVAGMVAVHREMAALRARETRLLADAAASAHRQAEAARRGGEALSDIPLRSLAAQIGAATRTSDRTVQTRVNEAEVLATRFAATLAALDAGALSAAHARVIVDAGLPIADDEARAAFETEAIAVASRETVGRSKPVIRMLAERHHPRPLDERHVDASARRRVFVRDLDDGMAELGAVLPAPLAHGIHDRLTRIARAVIDARRHADDSARDLVDAAATPSETRDADRRGIDAVRADALSDLLLTGDTHSEATGLEPTASRSIRAHVQVVIPVETLTGTGDAPAQLVGRGPIAAADARRLAACAPGWDRLFIHPRTGHLLAVDRYQPTRHQQRLLAARDEHCRFPGCRQPTYRCDIDHTVARAHDGPTDICNLAHLCRRHHTLKHASAWRVHHRRDGVLVWTSPTGRRYCDAPARTLVFTTDASLRPDQAAEIDEPPPF